MPFIHNERKGSWVASTECLSVLSIIKEGIRTPGPTVHVCLALHRVHFDGKFINQYRHVLFSPWPQNPSCGTRPHQKPTDHLQSFGVRTPDFWCLNTDRPWDPWLSADEWPQSQHSVHWPLLSWLAVHADSEHPPRDIRHTWRILPNHDFSSVGYRIAVRLSPGTDTKKLTSLFFSPLRALYSTSSDLKYWLGKAGNKFVILIFFLTNYQEYLSRVITKLRYKKWKRRL